MDTTSNPDHGQGQFTGGPAARLNPTEHPTYPAHPHLAHGGPTDQNGPRFLGPPVHVVPPNVMFPPRNTGGNDGEGNYEHQGGGGNGGHVPVDIPPNHPGGGGGQTRRGGRGVVRGSNTDPDTGSGANTPAAREQIGRI